MGNMKGWPISFDNGSNFGLGKIIKTVQASTAKAQIVLVNAKLLAVVIRWTKMSYTCCVSLHRPSLRPSHQGEAHQ